MMDMVSKARSIFCTLFFVSATSDNTQRPAYRAAVLSKKLYLFQAESKTEATENEVNKCKNKSYRFPSFSSTALLFKSDFVF